MPLREVVIVPVLVAPLGVGRENSIRLVNESTSGGNRLIGVACMKDPTVENPTLDDVYKIGTVVAIRMMAQVPEGIKLIVQGIQRFEILEAVQTSPYLRVKIRPIEEPTIAKRTSWKSRRSSAKSARCSAASCSSLRTCRTRCRACPATFRIRTF